MVISADKSLQDFHNCLKQPITEAFIKTNHCHCMQSALSLIVQRCFLSFGPFPLLPHCLHNYVPLITPAKAFLLCRTFNPNNSHTVGKHSAQLSHDKVVNIIFLGLVQCRLKHVTMFLELCHYCTLLCIHRVWQRIGFCGNKKKRSSFHVSYFGVYILNQ